MATIDAKKAPFDAWLWSLDDRGLSDLTLRDLARTAMEAGVEIPQLTFLTVISDTPTAFARLRAFADDAIDEVRETEGLGLMRARSGKEDFVVAFWSTGTEGVYHLMSAAPVTGRKWRLVEDRWVRRSRTLAPVLLDKADFEAIGDSLSEHGQVEVSRLAARVLSDHSSYSRGWQSAPDRVRPSHRDALKETDGMLVRTMTLSMANLILHLRRASGATFYRGDYRLFIDRVLQRLVSAASSRRELLSGRERAASAAVVDTLVMDLDEPILGSVEGREALLDSLHHLSGVQTAVFHGNPYLHLTATDFADGSNFDIVASDSERLQVIPGYRASVTSLSRITEALGEALGMVSLSEQLVPEKIPDGDLLVQ